MVRERSRFQGGERRGFQPPHAGHHDVIRRFAKAMEGGRIEAPGFFTEVAFEGHAAANDAAGVLKFFDVEEALELVPFGGELLVLEKGFFLFVEFLGLFEHFFVAAGFDEALELGDDGLGLGRRRRVDEMKNAEWRVKNVRIFDFCPAGREIFD